MRSIPLRRWLWLVAVWIPFPCLFLPFTFMKEDYHPWYIDYTGNFFMLAILYYIPVNCLSAGVRLIFGYAPSMHVAAFIQSLLLSYVVLKTGRKKAVPADTSGP